MALSTSATSVSSTLLTFNVVVLFLYDDIKIDILSFIEKRIFFSEMLYTIQTNDVHILLVLLTVWTVLVLFV